MTQSTKATRGIRRRTSSFLSSSSSLNSSFSILPDENPLTIPSATVAAAAAKLADKKAKLSPAAAAGRRHNGEDGSDFDEEGLLVESSQKNKKNRKGMIGLFFVFSFAAIGFLGMATLSPLSRYLNPQPNYSKTANPKDGNETNSKEFHPTSNNNNNNNDDNKDGNDNAIVYVAGIVRDASKVSNEVWTRLIELHCDNGIHIHIVGAKGISKARAKIEKLQKSHLSSQPTTTPTTPTMRRNAACGGKDGATLTLVAEDEAKLKESKADEHMNATRIERITRVRDFQRNAIRAQFFEQLPAKFQTIHNQSTIHDNLSDSVKGAVIVLDLDLLLLPPANLISKVLHSLILDRRHHAVCAAGVNIRGGNKKKNKKKINRPGQRELWYYDTYATVLLPDTYVHPLSRRLIHHHYQAENPNFVRSDDQTRGNFTQADIMRYFTAQGEHSPTGAVPVRSCFGGLTVYDAATYFETKCQYVGPYQKESGNKTDLPTIANLVRYATKKDGRPCEHVVFHECLRWTDSSFSIAVHPNFITLWAKGT